MGEYRVRIAAPEPDDAVESDSSCPTDGKVEVKLQKNRGMGDAAAPQLLSYSFAEGKPLRIPLSVPQADGKGGLYTSLSLKALVREADGGQFRLY